MRRICQVCLKEIVGSAYWDKIRKADECSKCYLSPKSKIKNEKSSNK